MSPDEVDLNVMAWMNGRLVPFSQACIPVWDLGVVAGAAISEMARSYRHKPFRLQQHIQRLLDSCAELGFYVPYSGSQLLDAAETILTGNCRQIAEVDDLGIVAFVTAGANPTYLGFDAAAGPTVCLHTFSLPFAFWQDAATNGVRLSVPHRRQISESSLPVHRKVRNRLHWWLADKEADRIEAGSRALLLNSNDQVTETSTACFYAVIDDVIVTPRADVLDSVTRQIASELARSAGITFQQSDLTLPTLASASEAFVSSTPFGLLPVRTINGQSVGHSFPGTVYKALQSAWTLLTGVDTTAQIMIPRDPSIGT